MTGRNVLLVAGRELTERVRRPGFWITSLLIPALMIAAVVLPNVLARRGSSARVRVAVLDPTGVVAAGFDQALVEAQERRLRAHRGDKEGSKEPPAALRMKIETSYPPAGEAPAKAADDLERKVLDGEIDGYLVIPAGILDAPAPLEFHSKELGSLAALGVIEEAGNRQIARARLRRSGVDPALVDRLSVSSELKPVAVPRGSSPRDAESAVVVAILAAMLSYTMLIIYGQIVLRAVLEEKTNRVVEILVTSVSSDELMAGKILGVGAVGLLQVALWAMVAGNLSLPGVLVTSGAPGSVPAGLVAAFLGYFLLGFFLYATIFAGIGAAFDSEQDAQQYATLAITLLVFPLMFLGYVLNDPSGSTSTLLSLVPFFAPILMPIRLALSQPPAWQIALSIALLLGATGLLSLLAGRIYRVGVLMYGKKPTIPEIVRWARRG